MFSIAEQAFLERTRVARLATAGADGQPHVLPVVFAFDERRIYTPLDDKPKRVEPRQLKRVRNLLQNGHVALVADEYDEDWTRLAWVMVTGTAAIVQDGEVHANGVRLLLEKYPQYEAMPIGHRPLIVITPVRVRRWGARFA